MGELIPDSVNPQPMGGPFGFPPMGEMMQEADKVGINVPSPYESDGLYPNRPIKEKFRREREEMEAELNKRGETFFKKKPKKLLDLERGSHDQWQGGMPPMQFAGPYGGDEPWMPNEYNPFEHEEQHEEHQQKSRRGTKFFFNGTDKGQDEIREGKTEIQRRTSLSESMLASEGNSTYGSSSLRNNTEKHKRYPFLQKSQNPNGSTLRNILKPLAFTSETKHPENQTTSTSQNATVQSMVADVKQSYIRRGFSRRNKIPLKPYFDVDMPANISINSLPVDKNKAGQHNSLGTGIKPLEGETLSDSTQQNSLDTGEKSLDDNTTSDSPQNSKPKSFDGLEKRNSMNSPAKVPKFYLKRYFDFDAPEGFNKQRLFDIGEKSFEQSSSSTGDIKKSPRVNNLNSAPGYYKIFPRRSFGPKFNIFEKSYFCFDVPEDINDSKISENQNQSKQSELKAEENVNKANHSLSSSQQSKPMASDSLEKQNSINSTANNPKIYSKRYFDFDAPEGFNKHRLYDIGERSFEQSSSSTGDIKKSLRVHNLNSAPGYYKIFPRKSFGPKFNIFEKSYFGFNVAEDEPQEHP